MIFLVSFESLPTAIFYKFSWFNEIKTFLTIMKYLNSLHKKVAIFVACGNALPNDHTDTAILYYTFQQYICYIIRLNRFINILYLYRRNS